MQGYSTPRCAGRTRSAWCGCGCNHNVGVCGTCPLAGMSSSLFASLEALDGAPPRTKAPSDTSGSLHSGVRDALHRTLPVDPLGMEAGLQFPPRPRPVEGPTEPSTGALPGGAPSALGLFVLPVVRAVSQPEGPPRWLWAFPDTSRRVGASVHTLCAATHAAAAAWGPALEWAAVVAAAAKVAPSPAVAAGLVVAAVQAHPPRARRPSLASGSRDESLFGSFSRLGAVALEE